MLFDAAGVGVLDHLHRQIVFLKFAEPQDRGFDLAHRFGQGFALFLRQQTGQFHLGTFHGIGHLADHLATLFYRACGPCGKCRLGGRDGFVQLVDRGARASSQHLFGGGVDNVDRIVTGDETAIDKDLVVRHDLSSFMYGLVHDRAGPPISWVSGPARPKFTARAQSKGLTQSSFCRARNCICFIRSRRTGFSVQDT